MHNFFSVRYFCGQFFRTIRYIVELYDVLNNFVNCFRHNCGQFCRQFCRQFYCQFCGNLRTISEIISWTIPWIISRTISGNVRDNSCLNKFTCITFIVSFDRKISTKTFLGLSETLDIFFDKPLRTIYLDNILDNFQDNIWNNRALFWTFLNYLGGIFSDNFWDNFMDNFVNNLRDNVRNNVKQC